jgi:circadian clock protein KaiC
MHGGEEMERPRASTGVEGLDQILRGGLPRGKTYLALGVAGTGKTTLGLHFLRAGADAGERTLYVTMIQGEEELTELAASHGWSVDGIDFLDLPMRVRERAAQAQTVFRPSEAELSQVTETILQGIDEHGPDRVVLDSISELAALTTHHYQLRSPILRIKNLLGDMDCTALLTCGELGERTAHLNTIVHGVIELEMSFPSYGPHRRRIKVHKMRGMSYQGGYHDFCIRTGGLEVYPRLERPQGRQERSWRTIGSGIDEIDQMLGGGLEMGTACLVTGASGAGKSTLASLYVQEASKEGMPSVIFCFDERKETFLRRSESLDIHVSEFIDRGLLDLRSVSAGELSPGEFSHMVREAVEEDGVRVVVIDSISGYLNAMPEQRHLQIQLHELLSYLGGAGVLTLMIMTTHGMYGQMESSVDVSYIADTVLLLRHFESRGQMRKCLAALKKRHGGHEKTIREFEITRGGGRVGEPLREFSGVLTGNPTFTGSAESLLETDHDSKP